jgi:hypothetical protein
VEQTITNGQLYNDTIMNAVPISDIRLFVIQYSGNAGGAITNGVTNITFSNKLIDTDNIWTGSSFITQFSSSYSFSGSVVTVGLVSLSIELYIDGVLEKRIGAYVNSSSRLFAGDAYITKGKTVSLRPTLGSDTLSNTALHNINISTWRNMRTQP